jgi:fermentation-respiration switch protein FrsA (DUF1100 family)
MLSGLFSLLAIAAGVLLALLALAYWRQDAMIFFPRPNDPMLALKQRDKRVEIRSGNARLEGWWIDNPRAHSPAIILYFGGNAEDVLYSATTASLLDARRMLVVNYRGYGGSTGKPGQSALYEDALNIYDFAIRSGASPEHIILMGRSLGSAAAAMLAAHRQVAGVVLITPFDSLADVGARHYPFLPVRLLLRHPFAAVKWARQARAPALVLAAQRDAIVPPEHARRLYDAWFGAKEFRLLENVGHNDIELHPAYYEAINTFIAARFTADA